MCSNETTKIDDQSILHRDYIETNLDAGNKFIYEEFEYNQNTHKVEDGYHRNKYV
jgi:hypothetical protein